MNKQFSIRQARQLPRERPTKKDVDSSQQLQMFLTGQPTENFPSKLLYIKVTTTEWDGNKKQ